MRSLFSRRYTLLGLVLFVFACVGDEDSGVSPVANSNEVQLESTRTTSATIGVSGGEIRVTSSSGVRYFLFIPSGALAAETVISVTPITSMGKAPLAEGLRGAVRFSPSGLVFQREVTLRIESATPARAGRRSVGFSRSEDGKAMQLSLLDTNDGVLNVPVFHFSDAGVADGSEAEIADVPLSAASKNLNNQIMDAPMQIDLATVSSLPGLATFLKDLFFQMVKPAMDAGTASTDVKLKETGLIGYMAWSRLFFLMASESDRQPLKTLLATTLEVGQPQVAGLLSSLLTTQITECTSNSSVVILEKALSLRMDAEILDVTTQAFGLDPAKTLLQLNDCMRLVIDPIDFPNLVTVGSPRSLDAKAVLVPATRPQELLDALVEFTVTSLDATVAQSAGLSDKTGHYTVVVIPTVTSPSFNVKACYSLRSFFGPTTTDFCTTVNVQGAEPPPPFKPVTFKGSYIPAVSDNGKACAIGERSGPSSNTLTAFLTLETEKGGLFILDTQNDNIDDNRGFFARVPISGAIVNGVFSGSGGGPFSGSDRVTYRGSALGGAVDLAVTSLTANGVECSGRFVGSETDEIKL